jgi:2'-5' RNA ligase
VVQSVELLLDPDAEALIRNQWARLAAAGLPSQAQHTGDSNAPHVTLAARASIDPAVEPSLRRALAVLPLPVGLGALACFGHRRLVLVRLVVPSAALLGVQAEIETALGDDPATPAEASHFAPGRWTPHVTLARRMSPDQLAQAVSLLDGEHDPAVAAQARRWDSDARRVWPLA